MDKKFFLHSIKVSLEAAGFSVDDLVQYYAKKKKNSSVGSSWEKFPFEVMYEGMIRSRNPLKGKKPLGVIFKNHLITLHNSPEGMNLDKATKYCKKVKIEGHVCQIGDIEFW